jgi:GntR family histidine utilization transcriptional repressor
MTPPQFNSWQAIQDEVLRRIHARDWPPGHVIPGEVELAAEFGCARATVNRALRTLAEAGILERRRKAGTRVALHPVSRATVDIPILSQEIEDRGSAYGYRLLARDTALPPARARIALCPDTPAPCLHVRALHLADGAAFALEDRWISLATVPQAAAQDFETLSANEWLVSTAPYTHGDIGFTAAAAGKPEARDLGCAAGAPIFVIERTTWDQGRAITTVRLSYAPGYRIHTTIGA